MRVTVKQQGINNSEPVEMVWCRDGDEVNVMVSVAQLLEHARDEAPWAPRILEIRVEL